MKQREEVLLTTLMEYVDKWGDVNLTMVELSELTGYSRTTLWRALQALEEMDKVDTTRTKRNYGKLYKNRYKLVETSTAGQGSQDDNLTTETTEIAIVKNATHSLALEERKEGEEMVNKWVDEDDVAGVGLLDEKPVAQKVSKRDPKTRHQRPQEEWTAGDVASEFSWRVYDNVRGIPGLVNTMNLRGALAKNRTKFGITAEVEMKLMDKFFADGRNLATIKKFPKGTVGLFLNFITNNIGSVSNEVTVEEAVAMAETLEYLIATDGRKFDNSVPGRKALERYEQKLKELS
jgi:hypothetical protein